MGRRRRSRRVTIAHGPDEFTYDESGEPDVDEEFTVTPVEADEFSWLSAARSRARHERWRRRRWWHRLMFWRR